VIAAPPSEVGAVHETLAEPSDATATTLPGGPGTVSGSTGSEVVDPAPVPATFVAVTVKV
jgi:hypothetical protein